MSKRLTKLDIDQKLQNAKLENEVLKSKLEDIDTVSCIREREANAQGYRQAIQDVMQLLQKIFGKDEVR